MTVNAAGKRVDEHIYATGICVEEHIYAMGKRVEEHVYATGKRVEEVDGCQCHGQACGGAHLCFGCSDIHRELRSQLIFTQPLTQRKFTHSC